MLMVTPSRSGPAFLHLPRGFFRMATLHLVERHGGRRMLGAHFRSESGKGPAGDERLSALLRQWPAVEPGNGFEAAVWRRIRAAPTAQPAGLWDRWLDWFVPHPIWAGAAAAAAALAIGLLAGLATPGSARAGGHDTHALLHPRTLMGTYAALSEEGHP